MKPQPTDELSAQSGPSDSYLVAMLGAPGVGKCALLSQFRTSECINAYESGRGKCSMHEGFKKMLFTSGTLNGCSLTEKWSQLLLNI